jgi:hypothetical protein
LREAFQILEQENFIVSVPRKGRYITEISKKNYENIHESRRMMECYAIDRLKAKNVRDLPVIEGVLAKVCESTKPTEGPFESRNIGDWDTLNVSHVAALSSPSCARVFALPKGRRVTPTRGCPRCGGEHSRVGCCKTRAIDYLGIVSTVVKRRESFEKRRYLLEISLLEM